MIDLLNEAPDGGNTHKKYNFLKTLKKKSHALKNLFLAITSLMT